MAEQMALIAGPESPEFFGSAVQCSAVQCSAKGVTYQPSQETPEIRYAKGSDSLQLTVKSVDQREAAVKSTMVNATIVTPHNSSLLTVQRVQCHTIG
jgi:hypothetical protein